MARYLFVAHQTATDPLVISRVREVHAADPRAVFTILVPETHVSHFLVCDEVATREAAQQRATEVLAAFQRERLPVARAETGVSDPLQAIEDEVRLHADEHDAVILSTFAPGASRWLRLDLPRRVEQHFDLPVLHVYEGGDEAWQATTAVRARLASGQVGPVAVAARPGRMHRLLSRVPLTPLIVLLLMVHVALMVGLAVTYDMRFLRTEVLFIAIMAMIVLVARDPDGVKVSMPFRRQRTT